MNWTMNWNQLQEYIEQLTEEQRKMPVVLVNEDDEILEIDNHLWTNNLGGTHCEQLTKNLHYRQPYLTC